MDFDMIKSDLEETKETQLTGFAFQINDEQYLKQINTALDNTKDISYMTINLTVAKDVDPDIMEYFLEKEKKSKKNQGSVDELLITSNGDEWMEFMNRSASKKSLPNVQYHIKEEGHLNEFITSDGYEWLGRVDLDLKDTKIAILFPNKDKFGNLERSVNIYSEKDKVPEELSPILEKMVYNLITLNPRKDPDSELKSVSLKCQYPQDHGENGRQAIVLKRILLKYGAIQKYNILTDDLVIIRPAEEKSGKKNNPYDKIVEYARNVVF